jgi:hypothetical protein
MKNAITIFLVLITFKVFGQDPKKLGKSFVMLQNYNAQTCNAVGDGKASASDPLQRTYIIIVEAMDATGYVISVPEFAKEELNEKFVRTKSISEKKSPDGTTTKVAQPAKELYFYIPFNDFDKVAEKSVSKHSFAVGIPTIPVKLRFGNSGNGEDARYFRFEGNINLGLSAGYKYSFGEDRENAINLLMGFTVASVQVDSLTTKGKVNSNTSAASFSPHIGVVFEVKKFQFGLYSGIDYLYGEPNKYWVYRNNPWLGIGIGYSIFSAGGTDSNK